MGMLDGLTNMFKMHDDDDFDDDYEDYDLSLIHISEPTRH